MKNWINNMFKDDNGNVSSKRFITFCCFILILVGFLSNLYFDYVVEEFIFESVMYIVLIGLGAAAAEKFQRKS
jgi:hypothetical protein